MLTALIAATATMVVPNPYVLRMIQRSWNFTWVVSVQSAQGYTMSLLIFKCIREEVDELHECDQSGGFFPIAYAGGKKPPKDLDDADGICDWLDERKVIDMQWTKLKDMMESARHLELDKKGDDD